MPQGILNNPDKAWRNVYIVNSTPTRDIHHPPQYFGEETKAGTWRGVVFWKVGYIYRYVHLAADGEDDLLRLMERVPFSINYEGVDEIPQYWLDRRLKPRSNA